VRPPCLESWSLTGPSTRSRGRIVLASAGPPLDPHCEPCGAIWVPGSGNEMYATYKLKRQSWISGPVHPQSKSADRMLEISVCEAEQSEEDETAYLLRSPANRERLLRAIENVTGQRDLVTLSLDDLQASDHSDMGGLRPD